MGEETWKDQKLDRRWLRRENYFNQTTKLLRAREYSLRFEKKKILKKFAEFFFLVEKRILHQEQLVCQKTETLHQRLLGLNTKLSKNKALFSGHLINSKAKEKVTVLRTSKSIGDILAHL